MKKRLRKKKRLGEFREFGFNVHFQYRMPEQDGEAFLDDCLDRLIAKIEEMDLGIGGGVTPEGRAEFFVERLGRGTVTPEEREALVAWLQEQPDVESLAAGELVDAWHWAPGNEENA